MTGHTPCHIFIKRIYRKETGDIMANNTKTYISERLEKNGYVNGIYIPWFQGKWYGRDIGTTFYGNNAGECCFNEKYIRKTFYNARMMGYEMAKIWLNEAFEGMLYDEKGTVIGVEPLFLQNLERLYQIARDVDLNISICLFDHCECSFTGNKFEYDKHTRFMQVPSETDKYIKNYVYPILELSRKYGVELVDIYAEPEADGAIWNVTRGMAWKSMKRFINQVAKAVKEFDPRFATTVSSGSSHSTILGGYYSDVDVDFYGCDIYNDAGAFADTREMLLERPLMLGEYGVGNYANKTDDEQIEVLKKYYANFEKFGVAGGFYWCYGWAGGGGEMHIVNKEGELRKTAAYLRFRSIDVENARKGVTEKDVPCLVITDSTDNIQWFGARGATEYLLECQTPAGFVEVDRVKQEEYDEFPDILHSAHADAGEFETYRVTAFFADGSSTVSPLLTLEKKVTF